MEWLRASATAATDDCLLWPFPTTNGDGYGQVRIGKKSFLAHRVVLGLTDSDEGTTRHLCGNRLCCNPAHLRIGTPAENSADMLAHGTIQTGSANPSAKLTSADVDLIRQQYAAGGVTQTAIAKQYGVSRSTIWYVVHGLTWAS